MAYEGIFVRGKPFRGAIDFDRDAELAEQEARRNAAELIASKAELDRAPKGVRPEDLGGVAQRIMAAGDRAAIPEGTVRFPGFRETSVDEALEYLKSPTVLAAARKGTPMRRPDFQVAETSERPDFRTAGQGGGGVPVERPDFRTAGQGGAGVPVERPYFRTAGQSVNGIPAGAPVQEQNPFAGKRVMTAEDALGERAQLKRTAGNLARSGAERRGAAAELARLNQEDTRRQAREAYDANVATVTARKKYEADQRFAGQDRIAQAQEKSAEITSGGKVDAKKVEAEWRGAQLAQQKEFQNRKLTLDETKAMNADQNRSFELSIKERLADAALGQMWTGELPPEGHQILAGDGKTVLTYQGKRGKYGQPEYISPDVDLFKAALAEQITGRNTGDKPGAEQATKGVTETTLKPSMPGGTTGQKKRDKQTGRVWTWNGTDWV